MQKLHKRVEISSVSSTNPIAPLSLKKNMLWNSFGSLLYQGCLWLTTVIVVIASPNYENSGILAYAMAIGNLFIPVAQYGTRTIQVSDLENKYSQQNYFAFRLFTIGMSFAIFTLYTVITTSNSWESIAVVVAFLLFRADEAFSNVCQNAEQKADRMDYVGKSLAVRGILCVTSFSFGLFALENLLASVVLMFLCCTATTWIYDIPHAKLFGKTTPTISKKQCAVLLKKCIPAVLANLLCGGVISISRQIFGLSFGDDALGIYAAVATPAVLIQMLASFLYAPLLTTIARKWRSDSARDFGLYLFKTFAKIVFISIVLIVLGTLCSPLLILIYGESIAEYIHLFPAVLVISMCVAVLWFLTDVFVIIRRLKDVLIFNGISFILMLALIRPLISIFYMDGLNLVIMLSYAAGIVVGLGILFFILKNSSHHIEVA